MALTVLYVPSLLDSGVNHSAFEREGNTLNIFQDLDLKNGSSHGQNLALTGLVCSRSLDSGPENRSPTPGARF